jgi:hypothetical protein
MREEEENKCRGEDDGEEGEQEGREKKGRRRQRRAMSSKIDKEITPWR